MKLVCSTCLLLCVVLHPQRVGGADDPAAESATLKSLEAQLARQPHDPELIKKYAAEALAQLQETMLAPNDAPDSAQRAQRLGNHVLGVLDDLAPANAAAKEAAEQVRGTVDFYRRLDEARRRTFDELKQRLTANPNDVETMFVYEVKLQSEHHPRNEPEETRASLAGAKEFLPVLKDKTSNQTVRETVGVLLEGTVPRLERQIDEALQLRKALIGRDAPPLGAAEVQAWINGPAQDADALRGRVVLLEFWAIWCGPCVRLFPQLRLWHEKYHAQGLTIVGVTGYENYAWDEGSGGPVVSEAAVPAAQEEQVLEKFVRQHKLPYPTAVEKGKALTTAYHVPDIPFTVLIDRRGKMRMIHFGAAKPEQVEQMITKLLAEDPVDG